MTRNPAAPARRLAPLLARLREEVRQHGHHPAFRIAAPVWDEAQRARLARLAAEPATPSPDGGGPDIDEPGLARAATHLWRARRRLAHDDSSTSRQTGRSLRSCVAALADVGVVIQDHDGEPYDPALELEVVGAIDRPDLAVATVVDTIRPSVYFRSRTIQIGQVVIGRPGGCQDA